MRRPRRLLAVLGISAVAVAGGAVLIATRGSTTAASASGTTPPAAAPVRGARGAAPISVAHAAAGATVRTATASVGGVSETILVNRDGLPLYTYGPDTATTSMVNGQLAALWPPLTANALGTRGARDKLAIVATANGRQVTFNGHFLYTFVEDSQGIVTGQGVQNFMVATPSTPNIGTSIPAGSAPVAGPSTRPGY
jgi:predicted lipoprotein with Yx(FWY)xxD motif